MNLIKHYSLMLAIAACCMNAEAKQVFLQPLPADVHILAHKPHSGPKKKIQGGMLSRWLDGRSGIAYFIVGGTQGCIGLSAMCTGGWIIFFGMIGLAQNHTVPGLCGVGVGLATVLCGGANAFYGLKKMAYGVFGKKEDEVIYVYAQTPQAKPELEEGDDEDDSESKDAEELTDD